MIKRSLLIVLAVAASAAHAQEKKHLKPEEYGQWESIQGAVISNDGHWFAYTIALVDGDGRLVIRNVDSPQTATVPVGSGAAFSDDSKWVAYMMSPPKKVTDMLREQKKPIENKMGLRNLGTGKEELFENVRRFAFLKGSHYLAIQFNRGADKPTGGSDLMVRDLGDGGSVVLGNVSNFAPNQRGDLIAIGIESDSKQQGVQLFEPAKSAVRTLYWSKDEIANLVWAKDADTLAFIVGTKDEKHEGNWNRIIVGSDLKGKPTAKGFDPSTVKEFPVGKRIAEFGGLGLSDDGKTVAFGIRTWGDARKPGGKPEDHVDIDVWNGKDLDVIPLQKRRAPFEMQRTQACLWFTQDNRFVPLGSGESTESVQIGRDLKHALLVDDKPYKLPVTNGIQYNDVYVVNLATGQRTKLLTHTQWSAQLSPTGKHIAYYQNGTWWIANADTGVVTAVAKPGSFANLEDDHTVPEKPPVSGPTWLDKDSGALFYDRYDAYAWTPSGTKKLTAGASEHLTYRAVDVAPDPDKGMSIAEPLYFRVFDERTKKAGFARIAPGEDQKTLIFADMRFGTLLRAKEADRMIFSMGSFEQSPNVFVTNGVFTQAKPITKTNPQQAQYDWGKTELIQYKSKWGKELHGTLIYPAGYKTGQKYPMVVYIYERLSDEIHNYIAPVPWSAYNQQVFSQNGYFVLMPDIAYRGRQPGLSAVECLEPAVQEVLKKGMVDPAKVGLMGHSWGAYQTSFVISQSKLFSAAVAGAPLTDLISMYGSIYWNSGTPDQEILETSQGRLEVPYWKDLKTYMDNSPMFQAEKIIAPILVTFGDQDGAVDWHQGQEFYTTMRRMGKDIIMLVYAGENHGLAKRANQLDYARRVRHFFDYHLKGEKPEAWITEGVPFKPGG